MTAITYSSIDGLICGPCETVARPMSDQSDVAEVSRAFATSVSYCRAVPRPCVCPRHATCIAAILRCAADVRCGVP